MAGKLVRPQQKPGASRPPPSKCGSDTIRNRRGTDAPKTPTRSWRADAVRLASEVERLTAGLRAARAEISELAARIDVDSLTETLNRRSSKRELKRLLAYVKRYGCARR